MMNKVGDRCRGRKSAWAPPRRANCPKRFQRRSSRHRGKVRAGKTAGAGIWRHRFYAFERRPAGPGDSTRKRWGRSTPGEQCRPRTAFADRRPHRRTMASRASTSIVSTGPRGAQRWRRIMVSRRSAAISNDPPPGIRARAMFRLRVFRAGLAATEALCRIDTRADNVRMNNVGLPGWIDSFARNARSADRRS